MTAVRAGMAAYNQKQLYPRREWLFDSYAARSARYALFRAYYSNTQYSDIEAFSAALKQTNRLYKHTVGIYNPVARQNRIITSNVYKGGVDTERLSGGALPIVAGNDALIDPLIQIIRWSNLDRQLARYVSLAALLGDVGLWVTNDALRGRVRLEVIEPERIREVTRDSAGNVKAVLLEWEEDEPADAAALQVGKVHPIERPRRAYVRSMRVTQEAFETFKDGEPFGFYKDGEGNPLARWDNEYGFVPLVVAHYQQGVEWGVNSFYQSLQKIDAVNDVASLLRNQIRNTIVPLLKAKNVSAQNLDVQTDERTGLPILFVNGEGVDIEPLVAQINIADAAETVQQMLAELVRDMPELALASIRENAANLTAPGVRTGYSDAIGNIENARKNLDAPLLAALLMGVTMGAVSGYDGFEAFDADSFDRGDMEATVLPRPVIPDVLTALEELTQLAVIADKPAPIQRLMLGKLGYSDGEIADVLAQLEDEKRATAANTLGGLADILGVTGDEEAGEAEGALA